MQWLSHRVSRNKQIQLITLLCSFLFVFSVQAIIEPEQDTTSPILNIISPSSTNNFNETSVHLVLEGRDETSWKKLEITIGGNLLFNVSNNGDQTASDGSIVITQTSIFLDKRFEFGNYQSLENNLFRIELFDQELNSASFQFEVIRDLTKPIIQILQPLSDIEWQNSTVELIWQIVDESNILSVEVFVNQKLTNSSIVQVSTDTYSTILTFPSSIGFESNYVISIVATDVFTNVNSETIIFSQFTPAPQMTIPKEEFDFSQSLDNLLFILALPLLILILLIFSARSGKDKLDLKWQGIIVPPPLLSIMEMLARENSEMLLGLTDTFMRIEEEWNHHMASLYDEEKSYTIREIQEIINQFSNNLLLSVFDDIELTPVQFQYADDILSKWKLQIYGTSTKWKKVDRDLPLTNLMITLGKDIQLSKKHGEEINDLIVDEWISIVRKINEINNIQTHNVERILDDFVSELSILISRRLNVSLTEFAKFSKELSKWVNSNFVNK